MERPNNDEIYSLLNNPLIDGIIINKVHQPLKNISIFHISKLLPKNIIPISTINTPNKFFSSLHLNIIISSFLLFLIL